MVILLSCVGEGSWERRSGVIRLLCILGLALFIHLSGTGKAWAGQGQVTILHTGSVAGHLFGCET